LGLLSSQEDIHREVEALRLERESQENEGYVLQKSLEELSTRLESQQQALIAKDDTISRLMEMLQKKGQENKTTEQQDIDRKKIEKCYAEVDYLKAGIEERDRAITSLQNVRQLVYELLYNTFLYNYGTIVYVFIK
jgi:chromosome segregation ATPase